MTAPYVAPVVEIATGAVQGRRVAENVDVFLGVPYAAAPSGENRLRPPRPAARWSGTRPAIEFGPTVPKGRLTPHFEQMWPERWIDGDESLNLNIWAPADSDEPAPVLVWIHGGGFTNGSGSSRELDGTAFALDGIVCVTINYRVAVDGFLFLDDGIANVGLLDQLAALDWVRENIRAFGGDPHRVTVAGHSAGGSSVACLLTASRSSGLFARAIVQSTSGIHRLNSPEFAREVSDDIAARLNVSASRDAIAAVPLIDLFRAVDDQKRAWPEANWAPTRDGDVLPTSPRQAVVDGVTRHVPLLTGTARDELRLYLTPDHLETIDDQKLRTGATPFGLVPGGVDAYRSNRPTDRPGDLLAAIETDWYFRMPTIRLAEARAASGASTWVYRFDRPQRHENAGYGAAHAVDVPFIFQTTDVGETHARIGPRPSRAVADLVHGIWGDFVRGNGPRWPQYTLPSRSTALLTESVAVVDDPDGVERRAWVPDDLTVS